MATIKFYCKRKSNPANLYIRFSSGRNIDAWSSTDILVNPKYWDKDKQKIRTTKQTPNAQEDNNEMMKLETAIIDRFTKDYRQGQHIDSIWLKKAVKTHFNRPAHEVEGWYDKSAIYFVDFMEWWLENRADSFRNPKSRKKLSPERIEKYTNFKEKVKLYEKKKSRPIKLSELIPDVNEKIMRFLDVEQGYGKAMVGKFIQYYNFFCQRAIDEGRAIPQNHKCYYQPQEQKKVLEPYFNEEEILKIYEYDFSGNDKLDNARDNLIIGLNTGLRISDFLRRLDLKNISDDYIEIETQKTGKNVTIPKHWMIRETLQKRLGFLPRKTSDQRFNDHIKEIAEILGFNTPMEGYLATAENGRTRKKYGIYPKHRLVSSHICRRSFATNNYGKVPNHVLMAIGGWGSEKTMLGYLKMTNIENAKALKKAWDKEQTLIENGNNKETI